MSDEYEGLSSTFAQACRIADAEYAKTAETRAKTAETAKSPAASTLMAAEYLWRVGDKKRLDSWLDEHSQEEIRAILEHLERKYANRSE